MKEPPLFLLLFILATLFFSPSYGENEPHVGLEFDELLEDENRFIFLTNKNRLDFSSNFDDPKKLLTSDNSILIKSGTTVTIEGNQIPEYSTILIEGHLKFIASESTSLKVQKIIVAPNGELTIGTNENPIKKSKNVEITFLNSKESEVGLFVFGKLTIHGNDIGPSFTELAKGAKKGDDRLVVNEKLEWGKGKAILTSPGIIDCNEEVEIDRINTIFITLKDPLVCKHNVIQISEEKKVASHIAFLNRNVKFSSEDNDDRGTVTFFHGSSGYIKYAEFDKLGPKNVLGRYPIHFHHMKDSSNGIEVIGNSITNSKNRWITIHDSNGIQVKNNVGYKAVGHGFFLEDGNEFENIFEKNIGIITTKGKLIKSDSGPAIFWTQNPMNIYRENVAVDGQYWGIIFNIPNEEVYVPRYNQKMNLRSLPSLEINDNIIYNYRFGGMTINRPAVQEEINSHEIIISNLYSVNSYRINPIQMGVRVIGSDVTISDSILFNNKIGVQLFGKRNSVEDTDILVERNIDFDSLVSGIVISGEGHLIKNSKISGYVSRSSNIASGISLSDDGNPSKLLSAKIINSTLLDPIPIFFGKEGNDNSFLDVYDTSMPSQESKNLPVNFTLIKIGTGTTEYRGEYVDSDFMAMIKKLTKPFSENFDTKRMTGKQNENSERTKIEVIKSFKNYAFSWKQDRLSDNDFSNEIKILVEKNLINVTQRTDEIGNTDYYVPEWIKNLVDFWVKESISDNEFLTAIEFILELQFDQIDSYRNY